jgi:hypothetical protein
LVSQANSGYSPEKIQVKLGIAINLAPKPENMKGYATRGEAMPIDDIACNYYDILKTADEFGMEMPNYRALESILNR